MPDNNKLPIKQDCFPAVQDPGIIMESVLAVGDLSKLTPQERCNYYSAVCHSLGLNPFTRPFEYIELDDGKGNKKLTLYATRGATDQMRSIHRINIVKIERETMDDLYIVRVTAKTADGRIDESEGCIPLTKEKGEWKVAQSGKRFFAGTGEFERIKGLPLADVRHKAETKAKRRVTLSILGLGWMIEDERIGMYTKAVPVNLHTGEIEAGVSISLTEEPDEMVNQLFGSPSPSPQPKQTKEKSIIDTFREKHLRNLEAKIHDYGISRNRLKEYFAKSTPALLVPGEDGKIHLHALRDDILKYIISDHGWERCLRGYQEWEETQPKIVNPFTCPRCERQFDSEDFYPIMGKDEVIIPYCKECGWDVDSENEEKTPGEEDVNVIG